MWDIRRGHHVCSNVFILDVCQESREWLCGSRCRPSSFMLTPKSGPRLTTSSGRFTSSMCSSTFSASFTVIHQPITSLNFNIWPIRSITSYFWPIRSFYNDFWPMTGLQRITAAPAFGVYFIFPALIYTFDKIVTFRTSYMELDILETELLPSDVLRIRFYRPPNMKVLSGQWIRFTCTSLAPEVNDQHLQSIETSP